MYVHWWEAVRDSQKWKIHVYTEGDGTKRSAAAPTEKTPRPTGCKAANKARGNDKEAPNEINGMKEQIGAFLQAQAETKVQTREMMELQSRLSAQKLEANRLAYEAAKERMVAKLAEERTKLFDKFTEMLNADTTGMEPWAKEMHVRAITSDSSEKDMAGKSMGSLEDMRPFFAIQVRRIWQEVNLNFENGGQ
ncbi:hypothetical protein QYE76_024488 [Lolium multiflorum]|uniref:No apical meristem-associated C-terminal domain-containing protein n=1 Tax=Lolium multiflorum TaxID=4521 RepID=A0AAD8RE09_LOLMU|nr:hypothetical protein QYE76_024488 [Lolium multiflorum]